jgi:hypothetical protein
VFGKKYIKVFRTFKTVFKRHNFFQKCLPFSNCSKMSWFFCQPCSGGQTQPIKTKALTSALSKAKAGPNSSCQISLGVNVIKLFLCVIDTLKQKASQSQIFVGEAWSRIHNLFSA